MKLTIMILKVMGSNPGQVKLGAHSTSVKVILEPKISTTLLQSNVQTKSSLHYFLLISYGPFSFINHSGDYEESGHKEKYQAT